MVLGSLPNKSQQETDCFGFLICSQVPGILFLRKRPAFSPESRYVAYQVQPAYEDVRQAKKKKLKEDPDAEELTGDQVLSDGRKVKAERVKSFAIPAEGSQWMAYLHEKALPEKITLIQQEQSRNLRKREKEA